MYIKFDSFKSYDLGKLLRSWDLYKYIPYPKDYIRRDGSKPEGAGYPYEDTWNCNKLDPLNSIAIVSFSKEKVGDFKGQKNEALIKRIVEAHIKEGDIVLLSIRKAVVKEEKWKENGKSKSKNRGDKTASNALTE